MICNHYCALEKKHRTCDACLNALRHWAPWVGAIFGQNYAIFSFSECRFQDPLNLHKYTPPKPNDLVNCHRIKGDLILEKVKITNNLELDKRNDACLRLIDVDMSDVEITAPVEKGTRLCENDEKSEIRNNKNFCYRELVKVEQYFKTDDRLSVDIHVDDSCGQFLL